MTILIAGIHLVLTIFVSTFVAQAADVTLKRTQSQAAADAAALAAVAESAPYGRGAQASAAETYAERNGAELVACDCRAGAYEVQVTVDVDGVMATARAEIDPTLFAPAVATSTEGLVPGLERAVQVLIEASDGSVQLVSGWRSPTRQRQLWSGALARYGDPEVADDWVARPGHSMHERGLAVDLGGDLDRAAVLVAQLGLPLYRPLANEPWHFELRGSRG